MIPKTKAAEEYFGSFGMNDFYVTYTSSSSFNKKLDGVKKSKSNSDKWEKWGNALLDISLCFADFQYSIPYTLVMVALGSESKYEIDYGSYNRYTGKFYDVTTRSIYGAKKGSSSNKKLAYSDQTGSMDYFVEFCPVGHFQHASYEIKRKLENKVKTDNPRDKNSVLSSANAYYNKGQKITWSLTSYPLIEKW